jgi:hemoglobin-like flavoprotein
MKPRTLLPQLQNKGKNMSELVKETVLVLGDTQLKLKFNFRAIMIFENYAKKSFFKLGNDISGSELVALVWAMATAAGHTISIEKIAEKIEFKDVASIQTVLEKMITAGVPAAPEDKVEKKAKNA